MWLLWLATTIAGPLAGRRSRPSTSAPVRMRAIGLAIRVSSNTRGNDMGGGAGSVGAEAEEGQEVEIERRGEDQAVEPVEDAAVPGNEVGGVLHPDVALDRGYGDVAGEPRHRQGDGDDPQAQAVQRRQPGRGRQDQDGGQDPAADEALPGLVGTDLGDDLAPAEQLA